MTQQHDDAFTPDTVDEQVDQLASRSPQTLPSPSTRVVQRLQTLYEEDLHSTERVWQRLVQHAEEHNESDSASEYRQPGSLSGIQEERFFLQGTISSGKRGPTRLMLVAAVLFASLLVSSLLWAAHITRSTSTTIPVKPTPTAQTAPASPPGVYLTKPDEISRLDAQTGKVLWRTGVPPKVTEMYKGIAGLPVVNGSTVYLIKGDTILAFDADKGTFRWSSNFGTRVFMSIDDGVLYVFPMGLSAGAKFYVVDPANGKIKSTFLFRDNWRMMVDGVVYNTIGSNFYALKLSNQQQLWHQQVETGLDLSWISVKNGIVYTSWIVQAPGNKKFSAGVGLLYAFDAKTGKQLWQPSEMPVGTRNGLGGCTATDDMVYCASSFGDLDSFDSHTGKHIWHLHSYASYLLADADTLYINYRENALSHDGGIAALRAKDGKKLWQRSFTGTGEHFLLGLQGGIIYTVTTNHTDNRIDVLKASDGTQLWHLSIGGDASKWGVAVA